MRKNLAKKDKNVKSPLYSYFSSSIFHDGLLYPEASNAAPKLETDTDSKTGYKYDEAGFGAKELKTEEKEATDLSTVIEGKFCIYEKKDYNSYWDEERKYYERLKESKPFVMVDNGIFTSSVTVVDEKIVEVITRIILQREVKGENYDGKSVRNGLFGAIAHKTCQEEVEIREYYQLISRKRRLLHYGENPNFFEVFSLPAGWKVTDGVLESDPKVFDDVWYDENDKDIKEIKGILNKKESFCLTKSYSSNK